MASEEELDPYTPLGWAEWQRIVEDPAYVSERPVLEWLEGRPVEVASLDEYMELYGRPGISVDRYGGVFAMQWVARRAWWRRPTSWAIAAGWFVGHLTAHR